jgi:hypothetical protein
MTALPPRAGACGAAKLARTYAWCCGVDAFPRSSQSSYCGRRFGGRGDSGSSGSSRSPISLAANHSEYEE